MSAKTQGQGTKDQSETGNPEGFLSSSPPLLLSTSDLFFPSLRLASFPSYSSLGWLLPNSTTAPQREPDFSFPLSLHMPSSLSLSPILSPNLKFWAQGLFVLVLVPCWFGRGIVKIGNSLQQLCSLVLFLFQEFENFKLS